MTLEELLQKSIDLNNEKLEVEVKRNELANKTIELNAQIALERKKLELEKVQVIIIESVKNGYITIDTNGTPRIDVLDLLRATPSRYYDLVAQRNRIDISYWEQFKSSLDLLPNIQLSFKEQNEEYLKNYFTEPLWAVSKNERFIMIRNADRNREVYRLDKIPSKLYNTQLKVNTVPFSEGWRIIQVLGEPSEMVEYSPDVLDLIVKQIEQRKKMDEAALTMSADLPNPFIGINPESGKVFELKDYQKATVFFMMTALGLEIPKIPEKVVKPW
jgi:hypothetical protein